MFWQILINPIDKKNKWLKNCFTLKSVGSEGILYLKKIVLFDYLDIFCVKSGWHNAVLVRIK